MSELARLLDQKESFIHRSSNDVIWIEPLGSMKHGRRLIDKCCEPPLDRLKLQFQIEWCSKSLAPSSNRSTLQVNDDSSSSSDIDQEGDTSADDRGDELRVVDDPYSNDGAKLFDNSMKTLQRQKVTDDKNKARSINSVSPVLPTSGWYRLIYFFILSIWYF